MTNDWEGYVVVSRIADHLNESNWVKLILELNGIDTVGSDANQLIRRRGTVDPYGFWFDTGEVDAEDEPILEWYSNTYIYAANFKESLVRFSKFANRLENLFGVDPGSVTYTTAHNPVEKQRDRPSVVATYRYRNYDRITVELMGCSTDEHEDFCNVKASNVEVLQLIKDDPIEWGETTE